MSTIPFGACHAIGEIPGDRERRIAQQARLAAGGLGLARLPVQSVGLDRKRLQSTQCIEPAFRGDRLIDEFARRLSLRRRELAEPQQQQRSRNRERIFHLPILRHVSRGRLQILSLLAFQVRAPRGR
jgi:hypothetical protein